MPRKIKGIPGTSCINVDGQCHEVGATDGNGNHWRNTDLTPEEFIAAWTRAMNRAGDHLSERCSHNPELARIIYNMPDAGIDEDAG